MTGVLNALVAGATGRYVITLAAAGGGGGFTGASFGSAFESNVGVISGGPYKGASLIWMFSDDTPSVALDFQIHFSGSRANNFFTGARVLDTSGATRTFLTASASVTPSSDSGTLWRWDGEATPVWAPASIGQRVIAELF